MFLITLHKYFIQDDKYKSKYYYERQIPYDIRIKY